MFVNCSNHKSSLWGEEQRTAAQEYGEIVDYPFPDVSPEMDEQGIRELAEKITAEIAGMHPDAVMCQGEFTLAFSIAAGLKECGIRVVAACSRRVVAEETTKDGEYHKISKFVFVRFREY